MDAKKFSNSKFKNSIRPIMDELHSLRNDRERPMDISLGDFFELNPDTYKDVTVKSFFSDLGIDPATDTIQNIFTMPGSDARWLVPEIFREAISLGLRRSPIWSNLIAAEQTVSQTQITMPNWEMSDAAPMHVGEAETIPIGTVSYGQKTVSISKIGRGIKISDEVRDYVSVDIVQIFLQDFGVKLGHAMDTLLIDILLNGEQSDGSASAPVLGITTSGTLVYKDFLRIFIRMSLLGRTPGVMVAGEDMALTTLDLAEFKTRNQGTPDKTLNLKTPVPNSVDFFIHGNVPSNQIIVLDTSATAIKLNAKPLLIESDRIISNQTTETYASLTTGFSTLFRDARVIVDQSKAFSGYGFPAYMDYTAQENTPIE